MDFFDNKGWQAQEYYNEYLSLKTKIIDDAGRMQMYKNFNIHGGREKLQSEIDEKIERMKFIFEQFRIVGISLEDLLFLSMDIEPR